MAAEMATTNDPAQIIAPLAPLAVDIESLATLEGNPRRGDVEAVARSLARFGQRKPIVVRASDRQIIAGNHTWLAARQLGWPKIAAVLVDDDTATSQAFALADNRTAELGSYDDALLLELIQSVGNLDPALLVDAGWDQAAIDELAGKVEPELPETPPDDVAPEPPAAPTSQPGDIWVLGDHRLICGDSTDPATYAALLTDGASDLVVTDPPYNVAYTGGTKDALTIQNDSMSEADFERFLTKSYAAMLTATKPGGAIYVFHAESAGGAFRRTMTDTGWLYKQTLVWVKDRLVLSRQDYHWQHEPILYGWKPGAAHTWNADRTHTTVIDNQPDFRAMRKEQLLEHLAELHATSSVIREPRPSRNAEHPTMKPVQLITRLVQNSSRPGQIVLDPFGGSGSTIMACEYAGRRGRSIELDPRYADVICRRWQDYTERLPVLEATGAKHDFSQGKP